jgi:hypothetical protein
MEDNMEKKTAVETAENTQPIDYTKWNVAKKLAKARVLLQQAELKKSGANTFAKFDYFELKDFLPQVNVIFDQLGLCAMFKITDNKAMLTVCNTDNGNEALVFESPIAEAGTKGCTPIQQLGSVHTYMRRYLYLEALEIVEHDKLDEAVGSGKLQTADDSENEMAKATVELMSARRALSDAGQDPHADEIVKWIASRTGVKDQDPGKLTLAQMAKVTKAYEFLAKNAAKKAAEKPLDVNDHEDTFPAAA